jgi:hypothetical protein
LIYSKIRDLTSFLDGIIEGNISKTFGNSNSYKN